MNNRLLTADQVKEYLDITDFRNLSKEKMIDFVSAIPYMDKDIAIKIIEQFPEYSAFGKEMVSHYNELCDSILEENNNSIQAVMYGYKQTLETLHSLVLSDNISAKERKYYTEQMIEIANEMVELYDKNKEFISGLFKYATCLFGGCVIAGAIILGVNIKGKEIPKAVRNSGRLLF